MAPVDRLPQLHDLAQLKGADYMAQFLPGPLFPPGQVKKILGRQDGPGRPRQA